MDSNAGGDDGPTPLFQPIGAFDPPPMPAEERLRLLAARFRAFFRSKDDTAFIADDRLQRATLRRLDQVVAPPACGPVMDELDATVAEWLAESPVATRHKLVILPACDQNDVLGAWAAQNGHQVLPAPDRAHLLSATAPDLADLANLSGDGLLAVPNLERWFLRHRNGLGQVRRLLAALGDTERRCVVGCNSWAWAFLSAAAGADLALPTGVTFKPFDANRLRRWFAELALDDTTRGVRFRLSEDGADVLDVKDDGAPASDFLEKLAARSLGIPWVAWHMWRRSLRTDRVPEDEADAEDAGDDPVDNQVSDPGKQTLWVAALDELALPARDPQAALLVLHALLIHEHLTPDELRQVLPTVNQPGIVDTLAASGFIEREGDGVRCRPAAYPAIRGGLAAAGYPLDRL